ncbi:MAG: BlaI/MecI/CopY family transcriptional regulator [Bacteroidota bacterium]
MSDVNKPTDSELEILKILWQNGPSTVREVHDEIKKQKSSGYTTILKLMQIMHEKELVERDESSRAHIYSANIQESDTEQSLVSDLMDRVFGGSAQKLVMRALESKSASKEELSEIRSLLDKFEEE